MPTGIWETSSDNLNSPEGNDGHYYRVFCKENEFQQAYRIASSAVSSLTYFRYCNGGTWRNWYKPYITSSDFNANNNEYLTKLKQQWVNFSETNDLSKPGYTNLETGGPIVNVLYFKHTNGNYGWAILCSYDHELAKPIYIRLVDGIWQDAFYL